MAAVLCVCAAAGVEGATTLRPVTVESAALVTLVSRLAEAARQARPGARAVQPEGISTMSAGQLEVAQPRCADTQLPHLTPLRDALLNLPPPARA